MLLGYVQDLVKTERFHTEEDAERWACFLNDDDDEEAPFTRGNVHVSSDHTSKVFRSTISSLNTAASGVKYLHFSQKTALSNSMILHLRH